MAAPPTAEDALPHDLPDLLPRVRDEWAVDHAAPRPWNNNESDYDNMPVLEAAEADTGVPIFLEIGEMDNLLFQSFWR
jgi:hypothetical protein